MSLINDKVLNELYEQKKKKLNKKNSLKVVKHKILKINSRKIKKFQKKTQKAQKKYSKFIKAKDKKTSTYQHFHVTDAFEHQYLHDLDLRYSD